MTEDRRAYVSPHLSPDGQRLAVTIEGHIWIYEIAHDTLSRATFGPNHELWAIWTPDGRRLTFRRDDPPNIFWQPADGSGEAERLTTSEHTQRPTSWSPDGKTLVFTEVAPDGLFDIGLLVRDGEPTSRPFLQTPFNEAGGVISPDGRFLAYASDESGRDEVYIRQFPRQGGKWQISIDGGRQPVWARNGKEIFYRNGDKMMVVSIETEPAFRVGKPVFLFDGPFTGPDLAVAAYYDASPDGQHFVMVQAVESWPTQIQIVQNWFAELKQRVPSPKR
jgi:serine/threonine-protein kinase